MQCGFWQLSSSLPLCKSLKIPFPPTSTGRWPDNNCSETRKTFLLEIPLFSLVSEPLELKTDSIFYAEGYIFDVFPDCGLGQKMFDPQLGWQHAADLRHENEEEKTKQKVNITAKQIPNSEKQNDTHRWTQRNGSSKLSKKTMPRHQAMCQYISKINMQVFPKFHQRIPDFSWKAQETVQESNLHTQQILPRKCCSKLETQVTRIEPSWAPEK